MARTRAHKTTYNFTGGLNTESSVFTGEANDAIAIDNFDIEIGGKVQRRLGVDVEVDYNLNQKTTKSFIDDNPGFSTFEWRSVNGVGGQDFLAMHVRDSILFYDLTKESLSGDGFLGSLGILSFRSDTQAISEGVSFSAGKGALFITGKNLNPFYVVYDTLASFLFTGTQIELEIRDFEGVEDTLAIDFRPTSLDNLHTYNLRNQGWPLTFACANRSDGDKGLTFTDPIQWTFSGSENGGLNAYPSNADVIYLGKLAAATSADGVGAYHPFNLEKVALGTTRAPRGHYILNVFDKDRVTVSGLSGVPNDPTNARPTQTAFFGGRVWYAGTEETTRSSTIYFSQLLTDLTKVGKCHQEQDPTAEILNDLLDTDGGTLEIPDMGKVYKLISYQSQLLIVASNGVWSIIGSDDTGFTPTSFSVKFITPIGAIGDKSIVDMNGTISYWSEDGIYTLAPDDSGLRLVATNISEDRVQSLFQTFSATTKAQATAFFDRETNKVFWAYTNDTADLPAAGAFPFQYDRFLVLDLRLGSFTQYSIGEVSNTVNTGFIPFICGIVKKPSLSIAPTIFDVIEGVDDVVEGSDDVVEPEDREVDSGTAAIKLITFVPQFLNPSTDYRITFSEFKSTNFNDWETLSLADADLTPDTGFAFESSLQTSYDIAGDGSRDKQIKHVMWHFERTETSFELDGSGTLVFNLPSSCLGRVVFDWTDLDSVHRWTQERELYRLKRNFFPDTTGSFDYGYTVISYKQRVRGRGQSVSFKLRSSPNKDMRILGWDIDYIARDRM